MNLKAVTSTFNSFITWLRVDKMYWPGYSEDSYLITWKNTSYSGYLVGWSYSAAHLEEHLGYCLRKDGRKSRKMWCVSAGEFLNKKGAGIRVFEFQVFSPEPEPYYEWEQAWVRKKIKAFGLEFYLSLWIKEKEWWPRQKGQYVDVNALTQS